MKLTLEQRKQIGELFKAGASTGDVATKCGITWHQARYWKTNTARISQLEEEEDLKSSECRFESVFGHHYAYLVGAYLGDGYSNKMGKYTWKVRFSTDVAYPEISDRIAYCLDQIGFNPNAFVHRHSNCREVFAYGQAIETIFPSFGPGRKHEKDISLPNGMKRAIEKYPDCFLLGCIDSDGCIYKTKHGKHEFINFTNKSEQIIEAVKAALVRLNIPFTGHTLNSGLIYITIYQTDAVSRCLTVLGATKQQLQGQAQKEVAL